MPQSQSPMPDHQDLLVLAFYDLPFKRQIATFLRSLRVGNWKEFTDYDATGKQTGRSYIWEMLDVSREKPYLTAGIAEDIRSRLQNLYDTLKGRLSLNDQQQLMIRITKNAFDFVKLKGNRVTIDTAGLVKLYEKTHRESWADPNPPIQIESRRQDKYKKIRLAHIRMIFIEPGISFEKARATFTRAYDLSKSELDKMKIGLSDFIDLLMSSVTSYGEGCTAIELQIPEPIARAILAAYETGVDDGDIALIEMSYNDLTPSGEGSGFSPGRSEGIVDSATIPTRASSPSHSAWRVATRVNALLRPWRRLRWLFSPSVSLCPLTHVISESGNQAYANPAKFDRPGALLSDLLMSWILWPLFTGSCALLALLTLRTVIPDVSIAAGVATGVVLSWVGGQVCATIISPLCCGAAAIPLCLAFAIAQGIIIGRFGDTLATAAIAKNLLFAVLGGPIGMSAPVWLLRRFPVELIASVLSLVAVSIVASGWIMAQANRARETHLSPLGYTGFLSEIGEVARSIARKAISTPRVPGLLGYVTDLSGRLGDRLVADIIGGVFGALAGIGIGIVFLLTYTLCFLGLPPTLSFAVAFGAIGSATFVATIVLGRETGPSAFRTLHVDASQALKRIRQERPLVDALPFGLVYLAVAEILCFLAIREPALPGVISLSVLMALFHSTFFTAAFVIAAPVSSRAAVIAMALEGGLGFLGFVMFRMLSGQ